MFFFDYLYYLIAKFYASYGEKGAQSSSSGIVAGFMTLNVMTIWMLYMTAFEQKPHMSKLIIIILFVIFQVYTYIRYQFKDTHSFDIIEQKWLNETEAYKRRILNLLIIYGVTSIIAGFGLAIFLGSRNSDAVFFRRRN